jgi:hypothetical protein
MADNSAHTMAVFRVLKNARRRYVGVSNISMVNISSTAAATPTTITGTVIPADAATAITMEIITSPGGATVQVQTVPVTPSGTFTATFSGLAVGAYQARITTSPPASHAPVLSNVFNKT